MPKADKAVFKKFSDISPEDSGSTAVAWGIKQGIINAYKDGTFKPKKTISRKEAVLMLYRFASKPKVKGTLKFKDVTATRTSDIYRAVLWGVQKKITNGKTAETFGPDQSCTRGQMATFLYKYKKRK